MLAYHTKAQVGFEMLITFSLVLVILLVFLGINQLYLRDYDEAYRYQKLQSSLDDMAFVINSVYQQGMGAKDKAVIDLPKGISSSQITGKSIVYVLNTRGQNNSFEKSFDFNLNGSLPTTQGNYQIIVSSKKGFVQIGQA